MKKETKEKARLSGLESEVSDLLRLERLLEKASPKLVGLEGEEVYLPASIYEILKQVTPLLAQGKSLTIVPHEEELTTQQAAYILNVSRPFLYTLLDEGKIPYTKVGTHRRIKEEDLFNYKLERDTQRRQALKDLIDYTQELGFYDKEER